MKQTQWSVFFYPNSLTVRKLWTFTYFCVQISIEGQTKSAQCLLNRFVTFKINVVDSAFIGIRILWFCFLFVHQAVPEKISVLYSMVDRPVSQSEVSPVHSIPPDSVKYLSKMREHFLKCIEDQEISTFPSEEVRPRRPLRTQRVQLHWTVV